MISVSCLDSKFLNNNNWYGRFQLVSFRKGEGLTIANALRRTLLTEKSNFYISWVDFFNAEIPYSILTGMRESIFDILLNLKQILFTSDLVLFANYPKRPYKWRNKKNYQWSRFENPQSLRFDFSKTSITRRKKFCLKKNFIFSVSSSVIFVKNCAILNNHFNQLSYIENIRNNMLYYNLYQNSNSFKDFKGSSQFFSGFFGAQFPNLHRSYNLYKQRSVPSFDDF